MYMVYTVLQLKPMTIQHAEERLAALARVLAFAFVDKGHWLIHIHFGLPLIGAAIFGNRSISR